MRAWVGAAGLALAAGGAAAQSADGLWRTEANDEGGYLVVEMGPCASDAGRTCGVIKRAVGADGENPDYAHLGREIVSGMAPDGPGKWDDGTIWAPDDDKTYSSSMELSGEVLRVEGCVLFICRGRDWRRAE